MRDFCWIGRHWFTGNRRGIRPARSIELVFCGLPWHFAIRANHLGLFWSALRSTAPVPQTFSMLQSSVYFAQRLSSSSRKALIHSCSLVPPALVFLAFSRGVKAAAVGLLMITAIALPFTLAGSGPLALMTGDMIAQILALQLFLATNSVLGLAIGAAASDRRRLMRQIRKSRARLRDKSREQQEMLAKAHLAERMAGVGHWTLNPVTQEVSLVSGSLRNSRRYAGRVQSDVWRRHSILRERRS